MPIGDSDRDYFTDDDERLAGSNPFDSTSTPFVELKARKEMFLLIDIGLCAAFGQQRPEDVVAGIISRSISPSSYSNTVSLSSASPMNLVSLTAGVIIGTGQAVIDELYSDITTLAELLAISNAFKAHCQEVFQLKNDIAAVSEDISNTILALDSHSIADQYVYEKLQKAKKLPWNAK